ncbi:MAG: sterol desaturase family protein [Cyanobacteria bacterium J06632_3]
MTAPDLAILITFWILVSLTTQLPDGWQRFLHKSAKDWLLDICGLLIQGIVIPVLQVGLVYRLLHWLLPTVENTIVLPSFVGFLLCVVLVDYGYYWNHRWLHSTAWSIHRVHHTVTQLDVVGASRNSLWSSFFILYLWVHAVMLYCLQDTSGYLWGISITAMLDLWRHSQLGPRSHTLLYNLLSPWLILPQDHAHHHSKHHTANFGGNLKLWDKLHGTYKPCDHFPKNMGVKTKLTFWQKLLYPFKTS